MARVSKRVWLSIIYIIVSLVVTIPTIAVVDHYKGVQAAEDQQISRLRSKTSILDVAVGNNEIAQKNRSFGIDHDTLAVDTDAFTRDLRDVYDKDTPEAYMAARTDVLTRWGADPASLVGTFLFPGEGALPTGVGIGDIRGDHKVLVDTFTSYPLAIEASEQDRGATKIVYFADVTLRTGDKVVNCSATYAVDHASDQRQITSVTVNK